MFLYKCGFSKISGFVLFYELFRLREHGLMDWNHLQVAQRKPVHNTGPLYLLDWFKVWTENCRSCDRFLLLVHKLLIDPFIWYLTMKLSRFIWICIKSILRHSYAFVLMCVNVINDLYIHSVNYNSYLVWKTRQNNKLSINNFYYDTRQRYVKHSTKLRWTTNKQY